MTKTDIKIIDGMPCIILDDKPIRNIKRTFTHSYSPLSLTYKRLKEMGYDFDERDGCWKKEVK